MPENSEYSEKLFSATAVISGIHFTIISSEKGICNIFLQEGELIKIKSYENKFFTPRNIHPNNPLMFNVFEELEEFFNRKRKIFSVSLDIQGTEFQLKVWDELKKIPFGKTISYITLAERLGDEKLVRAVGRANGENPVPIIIPCHRVINADGSLGGYSAGIKFKQKLLELEGNLTMELFE